MKRHRIPAAAMVMFHRNVEERRCNLILVPFILFPLLQGVLQLNVNFISRPTNAFDLPVVREQTSLNSRIPRLANVGLSDIAEPKVELDHQFSKTVWKDAALAAVSGLSGANATTVLMPSGAGDVHLTAEIVRRFMDGATDLPFVRVVVTVPGSLATAARQLYAETFEDLTVMTVDTSVSKGQLASALKQNSSMILLCPYSMMLKFGLAFLESQIKTPFDLVIFATAHILRAGGFHSFGAREDILPAKRRVFISARHMFGIAPGALLAPGQEPGFPDEAPQSKFGPEVYRLTHEDAERHEMTVPIRLQIIESTKVSDVAKELVDLHLNLGINSIYVAPEQPRLTSALSQLVSDLTDGRCRVTTGANNSEASIDALLVSGSQPGYVALAQEFPRLAKWQPGKSKGFIIAAGAAKNHAAAAWMAFAIEDSRAEEALQRTSVEFGRVDRRLKWNELPYELRSLVNRGNARKQAEIAIARGVEALGDPWDIWLGRLLAYQERHKHANARFLATQFGHELGAWLQSQRQQWERGTLKERKVARLKGLEGS